MTQMYVQIHTLTGCEFDILGCCLGQSDILPLPKKSDETTCNPFT